MAAGNKTAAQRQAEYRQRRALANDGEGDVRVNTYIATAAAFALKRLAARYCVTQREMLERLIEAEDQKVSKKLSDTEFDQYLLCTKPETTTATRKKR